MYLSNNFSGGTDGTTISTANSGGVSGDAFNTVAGTMAFENTNATGLRAPMSCQWNSTSDRLRWTGITFTGRQVWCRQYLYFASNPAADEQPLNINHETGPSITNLALLVTSTGKVAVNDSTGAQVGITTNSISLNQWIRYEVACNVGTTTSNGSFELRLYNSPDSFTATETVTGSSLNLETTLPDRVSWVRSTATTYQSTAHAITDQGWPGPYPYGSPTNPNVSFAATMRAGSW